LYRGTFNLNSEVEKLVLVLVVVLALEIPDIWPSNYPNKIAAGKSGSFRGAEAH
jgi:hypothetical protein